jgi:hypothetical protein
LTLSGNLSNDDAARTLRFAALHHSKADWTGTEDQHICAGLNITLRYRAPAS